MTDPLRQSLLARMGIASWQLRTPAQLAAVKDSLTEPTQTPSTAAPDGKLWLVADALPAPRLLSDICTLLAITPEQVRRFNEPPSPKAPWAKSTLLWLTAADPRWPAALVCPINPNGQQKRALWQQLQPYLKPTSY